MDVSRIAPLLVSADEDYQRNVSANYDDVFETVSARIARTGSAGKADIGALVFWKRLNASTPWVTELNSMPDSDVREATAQAVQAVTDITLSVPEAAAAGRRALSALPGFRTGDALASAVLSAAAPARMAVYDVNAKNGLRALGLTLSDKSGRYRRYMEYVSQLQQHLHEHDLAWGARRVDTALYWLGGHPDLADR